MTEEDMQVLEDAHIAAIHRCKTIGCAFPFRLTSLQSIIHRYAVDFIELHCAHGYLMHSFVSPLSNVRSDKWGGQSLENRMRYPLRILERCRKEWADAPLFARISASDWAEGPEKGEDGLWKQWGIEQSKIFVGEMKKLGVDLIDCSSGGLWSKQKISVGPGYQVSFSSLIVWCCPAKCGPFISKVPFAEALKASYPDLLFGAVGMITSPTQAEEYLQGGKADVVSLARELIRTPHWPMVAAAELGVAIKPANQYERGWVKMATPAEQSSEGRGKEQGM